MARVVPFEARLWAMGYRHAPHAKLRQQYDSSRAGGTAWPVEIALAQRQIYVRSHTMTASPEIVQKWKELDIEEREFR